MGIIKVYFTTWHYDSPERLLNTLIRFTPNCSGKWKNIETTLSKSEADYFIVFGGTRENIDPKRALYFGFHPKGPSSNYKSFLDINCLAAFPLTHFLCPGEIWIDYTYDELKALKPPEKKYDLNCMVTYQKMKKTYADRFKFLYRFLPKFPKCHLFGRPSKLFKEDKALTPYYKGPLANDGYDAYVGEHLSGKNVLIDYRYSLDFDLGPTINYVSERFYDSMLLWTMPIYFGSTNVEKFFPKDSFRYVDIDTDDPKELEAEVKKVINTVNSDFREKHLKAMAEARNLMLDKYQAFAYIHEIVNNIDYYVKEWNRIKEGRLSK